MLAKVYSCAVFGIEGYLVEVEVDITPGLSSFHIVGLPDTAVQESKERVRAAINNSNLEFPLQRITVNLAPADIKKEGPVFDLSIAAGILAASGQLPTNILQNFVLVGELSLDGSIKRTSGILPIALQAKASGKEAIIVPEENAKEAALVDGLKVYPVDTLINAVELLSGERGAVEPFQLDTRALLESLSEANYDVDFSEIKGQEHAKRALEVAVAGGHNVIMIGPPGAGKTMLARRLPTIMPPMSLEEALETTKLYSICGLLPPNTPIIAQRAFRAPHHTVSTPGLVGGGSIPKPGEVSLAHNGVLFLDELPEFRRDALEVLRQPMEDNVVTISRVVTSLSFPANFMLVAAMNPCPCGYFTDPVRECICTPHRIYEYRKKISGPLLDRIDIHLEIPRLRREELMALPDGESSKAIRARVIKAREIQQLRFKDTGIYCNAQMKSRHIKKYCQLQEDGRQLLGMAINQLGLSARAYDRILKLSRTIADLENSDQIQTQHIAEAIQYRSLDRKFWG